jgi:hypothetical protein
VFPRARNPRQRRWQICKRLVEELVPRPWRVVEATAATVFRKIARDAPTLLLDEVDTIWRGAKSSGATSQALRGVLNAGYRRGVSVPRCVGRNFERLVEFPVFCPKALAGIGTLPDTIADRAVCLVFARKTKRERTARFRLRTVKQEAAALYRGLARWALSAVNQLRDARPLIPEHLATSHRTGGGIPPTTRRKTPREILDIANKVYEQKNPRCRRGRVARAQLVKRNL